MDAARRGPERRAKTAGANRELDQALITASLAAHRAARWRAATELLSAASRRSPGVKVSANTVPG